MLTPQEAIQQVARKNGVTPEEVRREIELALSEGMRSLDPRVQAFWQQIPSRTGIPTVEEVVQFLAESAT